VIQDGNKKWSSYPIQWVASFLSFISIYCWQGHNPLKGERRAVASFPRLLLVAYGAKPQLSRTKYSQSRGLTCNQQLQHYIRMAHVLMRRRIIRTDRRTVKDDRPGPQFSQKVAKMHFPTDMSPVGVLSYLFLTKRRIGK
jgi:hypothetical protein